MSTGGEEPLDRRVRVLGIEFDALTKDDLDRIVAQSIRDRDRVVIANHNLHSANTCRTDPKLQSFFAEASYTHCDGMALIAWARLMGFEVGREHRVTYLDWIDDLLGLAQTEGWRLFHLGGEAATAERAKAAVAERFPDLQIEFHHGFFDPRADGGENHRVLEAIAAAAPAILFVGMGVPRQEFWIAENLNRIEANVVLPSGACFDYLSGVIPTPPRWLGQVGLEWAFRLASEPRRLGHRYLVEPFRMIPAMFRDVGSRMGSSPRSEE